MTQKEIIDRIFIVNESGKTEYSEKAAGLLYKTVTMTAKELEVAKYTGIIQHTKAGNHGGSKDNFACGFCFEYADTRTIYGDTHKPHNIFNSKTGEECTPCTFCPMSGKFKKNGGKNDGCSGINSHTPEEILEIIERIEEND